MAKQCAILTGKFNRTIEKPLLSYARRTDTVRVNFSWIFLLFRHFLRAELKHIFNLYIYNVTK